MSNTLLELFEQAYTGDRYSASSSNSIVRRPNDFIMAAACVKRSWCIDARSLDIGVALGCIPRLRQLTSLVGADFSPARFETLAAWKSTVAF